MQHAVPSACEQYLPERSSDSPVVATMHVLPDGPLGGFRCQRSLPMQELQIYMTIAIYRPRWVPYNLQQLSLLLYDHRMMQDRAQ